MSLPRRESVEQFPGREIAEINTEVNLVTVSVYTPDRHIMVVYMLDAFLAVALSEPIGECVDAALLDLGGKAAPVAGHQTDALD